MTLEIVPRVLLGGVLIASAGGKLASPGAAQAALATFGLRDPAVRRVAWACLIAIETALGAGVIAGSDAAAYAAAGTLLALSVPLAIVLRRGGAGRPCGCFGARSTVSGFALLRNLALAAGFAALPLVPASTPTMEQWLGLGLGAALLGLAALAVVVVALAREIGELRLRMGPAIALEIEGEGPELGGRSDLIGRFEATDAARFAVAVFFSTSCHLCQALESAVAHLGRDPLVAVEVFDEHAEAAAWEALSVPGSPYAVVLGLDGTVLAKGTFNSLGQLEALLATSEEREWQALATQS